LNRANTNTSDQRGDPALDFKEKRVNYPISGACKNAMCFELGDEKRDYDSKQIKKGPCRPKQVLGKEKSGS